MIGADLPSPPTTSIPPSVEESPLINFPQEIATFTETTPSSATNNARANVANTLTVGVPNISTTATTTPSINRRNYLVLATPTTIPTLEAAAKNGITESTATSSNTSNNIVPPIHGFSNIVTYNSSSTSTPPASANNSRWVTREIAALDFLLNIPLAREQIIVQTGWNLLQQQHYNLDPTTHHHVQQRRRNGSFDYNDDSTVNHQHQSDPHDCEFDDDDDNDSTCHDDGYSYNYTNDKRNISGEIESNNKHNSISRSTTVDYNRPSPKGTWWEKWIKPTELSWMSASISNKNKDDDPSSSSFHKRVVDRSIKETTELERPTQADSTVNNHLGSSTSRGTPVRKNPSNQTSLEGTNNNPNSNVYFAPGRRLEGDDAIRIQIPLTTDASMSTKQKDIARLAAIREWEIQTVHGFQPQQQQQQPKSTTIDSAGIKNNNHAIIKTATSPVDDGGNNTKTPTRQQRGGKNWPQQHSQQQGQQQLQQAATLSPQYEQLAPVQSPSPVLLDGRMFFSANSSYPIAVFSIIRYEPKREEAAIRRRKLEAIGGGGSQFAMPVRDWRGISYRSLLPRRDSDKHDKKFNRFVRRRDEKNNNPGSVDDVSTASDSSSSSSDDESCGYVPGLLDDPEMVLGRHRNVMIGDHVTGPIVASTIQFVEPALLKAELNKQFRERFDGWEPPKAARKYIGARVIQGNYLLLDPAEDYSASNTDDQNSSAVTLEQQTQQQNQQSLPIPQPSRISRRTRQGSIASVESAADSSVGTGGGLAAEKTIRMPPSLTLSKIRSVKAQALQAAINANVEVSTVALACVYFERLCLHCRVDKTNRRLTFAACMLLASKLNEANVGLVMKNKGAGRDSGDAAGSDDDTATKASRLQTLIRPNKRSSTMFASLLEFFTQDWSLSLKHLFDAEWGVFAALGFSLSENPTHVAFHFKRLMKALERNPVDYLGREMFRQWQDVLAEEDERRLKRERKNERRLKRKQERILNMHIEIENEVLRRKQNERIQNNTSSNISSNRNNVSSFDGVDTENERNSNKNKKINATGNIVSVGASNNNQDVSVGNSNSGIHHYFTGISLIPSIQSISFGSPVVTVTSNVANGSDSNALPASAYSTNTVATASSHSGILSGPASAASVSAVSSTTTKTTTDHTGINKQQRSRGIADRVNFLQRFTMKRSLSQGGPYDYTDDSISKSHHLPLTGNITKNDATPVPVGNRCGVDKVSKHRDDNDISTATTHHRTCSSSSGVSTKTSGKSQMKHSASLPDIANTLLLSISENHGRDFVGLDIETPAATVPVRFAYNDVEEQDVKTTSNNNEKGLGNKAKQLEPIPITPDGNIV